MIKNDYTIAVVTLQEDCYEKEYVFKCFDETIKNGDSVICDARGKYCVATVLKVETQEEYGKPVTKDIVCKIDDSNYKQRIIDKKVIATRNNELKEISKKLETRLRKLRDAEYYSKVVAEFSEKDPEIAALAKEYIELANME